MSFVFSFNLLLLSKSYNYVFCYQNVDSYTIDFDHHKKLLSRNEKFKFIYGSYYIHNFINVTKQNNWLWNAKNDKSDGQMSEKSNGIRFYIYFNKIRFLFCSIEMQQFYLYTKKLAQSPFYLREAFEKQNKN